MLEKKIEELGAYFDGMFRIKDGYNAVRIVMPDAWAIYDKKTDDYTIKPVKSYDNNVPKILFVGSEKAKIGEIMDFAMEVILNNLENETKKKLFQVKVAELASIFDSNQLLNLENLVFRFEKPKKVKKVKDEVIELEGVVLEPISKVKNIENEDDADAKVQAAILKAQSKIKK